MKALVKLQSQKGLWLQDVDVPRIGSDEVLIKISKTGICGTDLHIWNWDEWAQRTIAVPMIIGHEFVGEIVETGQDVSRIERGQRVSGEGHVVCMHSRAARMGSPHHADHVEAIGVTMPGAFAEYLALPACNVIPLPDAIDDEIGAILDPLGNAVHAALSFELAGEDVLITGAGPIGVMAAAVARHLGARHVVITDVNASRLALAANAVDVIPVNVAFQPLKQALDALNLRDGFAVGLEMSGAPSAFNEMIDVMAPGGKIAFLGLSPQPMMVDWTRIIFKSLSIKGVYGREMFRTWHKMIALLESGLSVAPVITHRLNAKDFAQGFEAMATGDAGKVILSWPPKPDAAESLNEPVSEAAEAI